MSATPVTQNPTIYFFGLHPDSAAGDKNNLTGIAAALCPQLNCKNKHIHGISNIAAGIEILKTLAPLLPKSAQLVLALAGTAIFIEELATRLKTNIETDNLFVNNPVFLVHSAHCFLKSIADSLANNTGPDLMAYPANTRQGHEDPHTNELLLQGVPHAITFGAIQSSAVWQAKPITTQELPQKITINGDLDSFDQNTLVIVLPGDTSTLNQTSNQETTLRFGVEDAQKMSQTISKNLPLQHTTNRLHVVVTNGPRTGKTQVNITNTKPVLDPVTHAFVTTLANSEAIQKISVFPFQEGQASIYIPLLNKILDAQAGIYGVWIAGDSLSMVTEMHDILGDKHPIHVLASPTMQEEHRSFIKGILGKGRPSKAAQPENTAIEPHYTIMELPKKAPDEPLAAEVVAKAIKERLQQIQ
jgi:hypothetical protein